MVVENSLGEIQEKVDKWIIDHGGYWPPLSMICAVMEELGELAKEVNSYEGFKPKKPGKKESNLGEELADLLFSIICIANHFKIDLSTEFDKIIIKYNRRDSKRF
jgi:NTP pyrophosphatase (non-canonical NTP hydrolase)